MRNESCDRNAGFHLGIHKGKVFEKMLAPRQRDEVFEFMRDGLLERIDNERVEFGAPNNGWLGRLNSLGSSCPFYEIGFA
jgi:hypothetical protein